MKANRTLFPAGSDGEVPDFFDDLLMAIVEPIKRPDGNHGVPELRQVVEVSEYFHGGKSKKQFENLAT